MSTHIGYAAYRRGKLYMDASAWAAVKELARKTHKSPKVLVNAGLKRGLKIWRKSQRA